MQSAQRWMDGALLLACITVLAWLALLSALKPVPIADERLHVPAIDGLTHGSWPAPRVLGMFPGYHVLAALPLSVFGASLTATRAVTAMMAIMLLVVVSDIERRMWPNNTIGRALLLAWNPLLLPFLALSYTETASLLFLALSCAFQARGRTVLAAGVLFGACLIRQSNLVWFGLLAAWALWDRLPTARRFAELRLWLTENQSRLAPAVVGATLVLCFYAALGGVEQGGSGLNSPRPNVAQIHVFGLTMGLLLLPIWVAALHRDGRRLLLALPRRRLVVGASVLAVGVLFLAFQNAHPFNNNTDFLRNHLLQMLVRSEPARAAACGMLLPITLGLWLEFRGQTQRRALAAVWILSAVYLALHWLVDPRYYLPIVLLLTIFTEFRPRLFRGLLVTNAVFCIAVLIYILNRGGPAGGLW